ncbi:Mitogen-activated protein kinase 15 [Homalodisca vitripennis]|nr:Mitogen-activated protein kinase 15 [Homalodisca vitripennis]
MGMLYVQYDTFHNASNEPALVTSIVPLLRDDVQLSVDEYRNKLYKVISRTERKTNKPCVKTDTNRKLSEPVMRAQTSRHTRRPIPTETVVVHKTPVPPRTATSNPGWSTSYPDGREYLQAYRVTDFSDAQSNTMDGHAFIELIV